MIFHSFIYFSLALQIVHKIINYNMTNFTQNKKNYKRDYKVLQNIKKKDDKMT